MRKLNFTNAALTVSTCVLALGFLAPSSAHAETSLGPHLGVNFRWEEVFLGAELRTDVADVSPSVQLQLNPSVSLAFLGNDIVAFDLSLNLPFLFLIRDSVLRPFAAPGLALVHVSTDVSSDTELFLNLIGGMLFDLGDVDPFIQMKVMIPHGSMVELMGGVLFTL